MHKNLSGQTHLPSAMLFPLQDAQATTEHDLFISLSPSRKFVPTSLDTLQLWTDKVTIPSRWDLPFIVTNKGNKPREALYTNAQGIMVYGGEAHAQLGPVHIRLARLPYRPTLHLTVIINPGEVLWGNNVRPVSKSDFVRAIERTKAILKSCGIGVQLERMLPQRLDWRRDYSVRHPIDLYVAYFKSTRPTSCNRYIGYHYETSICYGWLKERARFYDKPQQIQSEIRKITGNKHLASAEKNTKIKGLKADYNYLKSQGENVLRTEYETHPDTTLRRKWGINTLNELLIDYSVGERIFDEFLSNKILPFSKKTAENHKSLYSAQNSLMTREALLVPIKEVESYLIVNLHSRARSVKLWQR